MKRSLSSMSEHSDSDWSEPPWPSPPSPNPPPDWSFFTATIPSAHAHWSPDGHRAFAHQLQKLWYGFEFFINEVHEKKSVVYRCKRKLRAKEDDKFYSKWLWHGLKWRSNFDCFPSSYQGHLESVLVKENTDAEQDPLYSVYYSSKTVEEAEKFIADTFTPLSDEPTLTWQVCGSRVPHAGDS